MKKYLEELKTNPYWEIEPHFWYWSQFKFIREYHTFLKQGMSVEDIKSALYGEFDVLGKPIEKGFIQNLNFMVNLTRNLLLKDISFKSGKKNKEVKQ